MSWTAVSRHDYLPILAGVIGVMAAYLGFSRQAALKTGRGDNFSMPVRIAGVALLITGAVLLGVVVFS
ncbi:hypothetical protein RBB75_08780 [Tunturibacter empetritectus]|uniref:Uncharacterized protein n=1 Tax=Tunturiibacter empetritectus TaxID=3069691 RepID=A0AAU7ZIB3_9BACT